MVVEKKNKKMLDKCKIWGKLTYVSLVWQKPNIVKPISFHRSGHYHCADMGRPNKHGENLTLRGYLVPPLGALSWPQTLIPNAKSAKPNNVRL